MARTPIDNRSNEIERHGHDDSGKRRAHETLRRFFPAYRRNSQQHERQNKIIEQLYRNIGSRRGTVEHCAVIEIRPVAFPHLGQHRMGSGRAVRQQIDDQPVTICEPQPTDTVHRSINAVAVLVDHISVSVRRYRKSAFIGSLNKVFPRGPLLLDPLVNNQQQYIREIDHCADCCGNQQIQYPIGITQRRSHLRPRFILRP